MDGEVTVGGQAQHGSGRAHRIEVVEELLDVGLKLLGDEEAAIGINASLESGENLTVEDRGVALGAKELRERSAIAFGGISLLGFTTVRIRTIVGIALGAKLVFKLGQTFLAGDGLAELLNVGFQVGVFGLFVRVEVAARFFSGIEEEAHLLDEPRTLVLQVNEFRHLSVGLGYLFVDSKSACFRFSSDKLRGGSGEGMGAVATTASGVRLNARAWATSSRTLAARGRASEMSVTRPNALASLAVNQVSSFIALTISSRLLPVRAS